MGRRDAYHQAYDLLVSSLYHATTDTNDSCTLKHTGTSAAAPLAAGIIALALQANPNLTWRDVQHLIVWTSEYKPLSHNPGWLINGAGFRFDLRFGFGLLNANALVKAALGWLNVPRKYQCRFIARTNRELTGKISFEKSLEFKVIVHYCPISSIEHVELIFTAEYSRRGALEVYLYSPKGTKVQVLSPRPRDTSTAGFSKWPFVSVATWGETCDGVWRVIVEDKTEERNTGKIGPIDMVIHGTKYIPHHMRNGPRTYNDEFNRDDHEFFYYVDYNDYYPVYENKSANVSISGVMYPDTLETVLEMDEEFQRKHHNQLFMAP